MAEIILSPNVVVADERELAALLGSHGAAHYVYVLRRPDGQNVHDGAGTPIYVGEGVGSRAFEHVASALKPDAPDTAKNRAIRTVHASGGRIIHDIAAVGDRPLLHFEERLISRIGLAKHGAGPLLNEQRYAPAHEVEGRVMRKYAKDGRIDPLSIPRSFKVRRAQLVPGANKPSNERSVHGRLAALLASTPGLTGEQLLLSAAELDWSAHKSAYTMNGKVDLAWLAGYIDSAVYKANRGFMRIVG